MDNNQFDVDLDIVLRPGKRVKLNGKIITINPASLSELLALTKLTSKFKELDTSTIDEQMAAQIIDELIESFVAIIPELKGEKINLDQLFILLDLITKMAVPTQLGEMEKSGVKFDPDQKKILSDLRENSPDSSTTFQDTPSIQP